MLEPPGNTIHAIHDQEKSDVAAFDKRIFWFAGFLYTCLGSSSLLHANVLKYFYNGQPKAEAIIGRVGTICELACDRDGKCTEKSSREGKIVPSLVDGTLTIDIHEDIHRVYFLWGDGQSDSWENHDHGGERPHSFMHDYLWNGDFFCQIYSVSLAGVRKHYAAKITITGM